MRLKRLMPVVMTLVSVCCFAANAEGGTPTQLLLTNTEANGLPSGIKELDQSSGAILGFLVQEDFPNNGNLWPVDAMCAGPNRTILVAQSTDDTIRQYDEFGGFVGLFVSGQAVNNIRGIIPSADGGFLFTADWAHDDVHRFKFATGALGTVWARSHLRASAAKKNEPLCGRISRLSTAGMRGSLAIMRLLPCGGRTCGCVTPGEMGPRATRGWGGEYPAIRLRAALEGAT